MSLFLRLALAAVVACAPLVAGACDICGCSGGNTAMGYLPLLQRHFIGLRFQSLAFDSYPHGSDPASIETFRTADLWGRWQAGRRWQVIAAVPYQWATRAYDNGVSENTAGLADVSTLVQFSLLDPNRQNRRTWRHTLQLGAGAVWPTGATTLRNTEGDLLNPNIQPGTGATQVLLSGLYALQFRQWGLSAEGQARMVAAHRTGFTPGNRLSGSGRVFWSSARGNWTFIPHLGAQYEWRATDHDAASQIDDSGGWAAYASAGADVFWRNLAVGFGWQTPLNSYLSSGHVQPRHKAQITLTFLFGGKNNAPAANNPVVFPAGQPLTH